MDSFSHGYTMTTGSRRSRGHTVVHTTVVRPSGSSLHLSRFSSPVRHNKYFLSTLIHPHHSKWPFQVSQLYQCHTTPHDHWSQSTWQSLPQLMRRPCQCRLLPPTTLNRMDAQLVSAPHLSHDSFVSVQLNPPQYDSTPRLTSFSLRWNR